MLAGVDTDEAEARRARKQRELDERRARFLEARSQQASEAKAKPSEGISSGAVAGAGGRRTGGTVLPRPSSARSNAKLIRNAITHVCLAGQPRAPEREAALQALDASEGEHFVVLFRSDKAPLIFKGLYRVGAGGVLQRLHGKCPAQISSAEVGAAYFKYDSGAKAFRPLQTHALTPVASALALL